MQIEYFKNAVYNNKEHTSFDIILKLSKFDFEIPFTYDVSDDSETKKLLDELLKENKIPIEEYVEPVIPKPTLEELKEQKLNNLKSISDSFRSQLINKDMYIKSSLGFIVDADKDSQDNVQGLIDILPNDELTIQYRDRNNEVHNLNKLQLQILLKEMKLNGVELFNQKWRLESQIENAKSESELNQIDLAFQMMDFTSNI